MIGHTTYGRGLEKVLVIHDWFSDCTSYEAIIPYLDTQRFTYAFVDLRGYGKSKSIQGECTVEEASLDAITLANHLKWDQFHVIGHSMSGMIAQRIALDATDRVKSMAAIAPVPACGSPVPEEILSFLEDAARHNDTSAMQIVGFMTSNKLTNSFYEYKVKRWRETSLADARVAYLHMFAQTDFSNQIQGLKTPVLVIIGGQDAEGHSESVMQATFMKWYPNAELATIHDSGHYPMQETPVYLLSLIEGFLEKHP
jgi:pimeloyl-ACP methyl ester carboxylesterase